MKQLLLIFLITFFAFAMAMNAPGQNRNANPAINLLATATPPDSKLLWEIINANRTLFEPVISKPDKYRLQIIYTQIDRDRKNQPTFHHHYFHVGTGYFYPASTVKLPGSVLALEYLNNLKNKKVSKNTTMITEAVREGEKPILFDSTNDGGRPSVANYVRRILLVSDNDAFNRIYELLGQEGLNQRLRQLGFRDAQIIHRLNTILTETENRTTNGIKFLDAEGNVLFEQPTRISKMPYEIRKDSIGEGFLKGDSLVKKPLDFSKKNRWNLNYLHQLVQWVMFPESQPANQKLNLTGEDYNFLRKYMSMKPQESMYPHYDSAEYWPNYVKFLYYGSEKNAEVSPKIRIFNKVGDAYGFLVDGAYFADFKNKVEFILSAVLYSNEDGILNDDKYDYETISLPFMKNLGRVIYNYECSRPKKYKPDLSSFRYDYVH